MKPSVIIQTNSNSYRFKIKFSTLTELKGMGVDLLSEKGSEEIQREPEKLAYVFWKGLEAGEMKKFTQEEALDIFDEVMEELGPEEFATIIPKALAIKMQPPVKN